MTMGQVVIVWTLMVLQAGRRVYEHATLRQALSLQDAVGHWGLGSSFYICTSVAVWIEGSGIIIDSSVPSQHQPLTGAILGALLSEPARGGRDLGIPGLGTLAAVTLFQFAWLRQYRCHKHLAGLKKYSLPEGGMFRFFVCPHYTCECLIYLSMALAAAPAGLLFSPTLLSALLFVSVNLGVTAAGTRIWYIEKFGAASVAKKWNMILFVFEGRQSGHRAPVGSTI